MQGSIPAAGVDLSQRVPFHSQTEYQCGPAALAGVLGASGVPATPEGLAPQVYLPGRHGSLQVELLGATRRAGRIPYPVAKTPEALFAELQAGHPVLILQNLLTRTVPKWHYAVVVGADAHRNRVLLNSGEKRALDVAAPKFMRTWDWGGRWAMLALKPGELPASDDPAGYLKAVADFEAVAGAAAARPAYESARRRWPGEPRVYLALGNQAYASGDKRAAARLFRDGLAHAPGDPVLSNNYASAMGELGCRAQALRALDAVAGEAGSWRAQLAQTRAEVDAAKSARPDDCGRLALPAR
nr:PA2778 family cysteine peptidase [Pseudoxanthomonas helianthi]